MVFSDRSKKPPHILNMAVAAVHACTIILEYMFSEAVRKRRLTSTIAFTDIMAAPYLYQVGVSTRYIDNFHTSKYSERTGSLATAKRSEVPAS
jgi:hypothetical protein